MNDNRKFTYKSIPDLDSNLKTIIQNWKEFWDEDNEDGLKDILYNRGKIYDELVEYNTNRSLFDEYFNIGSDVIENFLANPNNARVTVEPRLASMAEKLQEVINTNHNGVGVRRGDRNIVQLFNDNNKYDGTSVNVRNRTTAVRELDDEAGNVVSNISLSTIDNIDDRKLNLLERYNRYMYDFVLNGEIFGIGYRFAVNTDGNLPSMLYNIGNINSINSTMSNRYGDDYRNYIYKFYNSFGTCSFVDVPSTQQLQTHARNGNNIGQLAGSEYFIDRSANNYLELNTFDIDNFFNILFDVGLDQQFDDLEKTKQNLVEAYLPGLTRINQPFTAKTGFDVLLNQNLLLEGNVGPGRGDDLTALFRELYLESRTRLNPSLIQSPVGQLNDASRFLKGTIANVPILDIERQASQREGGIIPGQLFDHNRHDSRLLTNDQLERGYKQNISGASGINFGRNMAGATLVNDRNAGALVPALDELPIVDTNNKTKKQINDEKEANSYSDGKLQFFPFMIETDNRDIDGVTKNVVCYFQALISSLNETSNPNWTPKHFFGRTEQIFTYQFTERNIDLGLTIYAETMHELANLKHRVNFLLQQTYGQFGSTNNTDSTNSYVTTGPIVRLTLGDLYNSLPGMITSLNIGWGGPEGGAPRWEMTKGLNMPYICTIQLNYRVLHSEIKSRESDFYPSLQYGIDGGHLGDGSFVQTVSKRLIPMSKDKETPGARLVPGIKEPQIS